MIKTLARYCHDVSRFIGVQNLQRHFSHMPVRLHLYHLSTALLVGFFAIALWIMSVQPGELIDKNASRADANSVHELPIWTAEADAFKAALISPFNFDLIQTFDKALEGHPNAQFRLATAYLDGQGVPPDQIEGYKWLLIAKAFGSQATGLDRRFTELQQSLDADQISNAQARMKTWFEIYSSSN